MLLLLASSKCRVAFLSRQVHSVAGIGPLRVLFFGRDQFSCTTFQQLHDAKDVWTTLDIVTTEDEWIGRNRKMLSVSPLKTLGTDLGLRVHPVPSDDSKALEWKVPQPFDKRSPHNVLISASYGRAVSSDVLSHFDHRLNVHPSLIPKYRGAAPIQRTILNSDSKTGVSIINMEDISQGFDTGDVHRAREIDVPENPTYSTLSPILAEAGGALLVDVLRDLVQGKIHRTPQINENATRARIITPKMYQVQWENNSTHVERLHRAITHQKPLWTTYVKKKTPTRLQLLEVALSSSTPSEKLNEAGDCTYLPELKALAVRCGDGKDVLVTMVKPEGKPPTAAGEWWNGVHKPFIRLGEVNTPQS